MEFVSVIVAAAGAYAFGAFWYMVNAKAWVEATGIEVDEDGRPVGGNNAAPFILAGVCMIVVAGMMRHIFAQAGIDTFGKGLLSGLGIGAFMVLPWILTHYAYSMRPRALSMIDGAYGVIGCGIMGAVLGLI